MPTFATPQPISVHIQLDVGAVRIVAGDRADTVVTVTPADPGNKFGVEAAQRVRVDHTPGALEITQSIPWNRKFGDNPDGGVVAVLVELPTGSRVRGTVSLGTFRTEGSLGESTFTANLGDIVLDEITDTLRAKGTKGDIVVRRAQADVNARTSTGSIRIAEVVRGQVTLTTSVGEIEVGVREGTAARLDVRTKLGRIRNSLNGVDEPAGFANTVRIHARTNLDDIVVHRA